MKHAQGLTVLASAAMLLTVASSPAMARAPTPWMGQMHAPPPDHQTTRQHVMERKADQANRGDLKEGKVKSEYPDTTRVAPELDLTDQDEVDKLNQGLTAANAGNRALAEQFLIPLLKNSKSKYGQALALQGLATVKYNDKDYKNAISYLKRSLAIGVMPNDTYFRLKYELAQFLAADKQYQPALDTIASWRAEGKKETAESYGLEGTLQYQLNHYPQAIAAINKAKSLTATPKPSWNQILMASYAETGQQDKAAALAQQASSAPNDAGGSSNIAAVLMRAHKYPQAIAVMEKARAGGKLSSESGYVNLAKMYLITAQDADDPTINAGKANQVLDEGLSKQVVKPSAGTYVLKAQAAELSDDYSKALSEYKKAQTLASNGEPSIRAARLLLSDYKYSQAKDMIEQGLAKGVSSKGSAYMMLGEAERGLKNKPATIAAMKKAAAEPDTAAKAKAWLKKAGVQ